MPYQQLEVSPQSKIFDHQGWTCALFNPNLAQSYYLAHIVQIDRLRFISLIRDYSLFLEQARMFPEVQMAGTTKNGDKVTGQGSLKILGRLKDLKNDVREFVLAVNWLKKKQVFSNEAVIVVELSMQSIENSSSLLLCGLSLQT
jgi:hypothetical protein